MRTMTEARRRRGATTVEFALTTVFGLVPLLMGLMEWGWYFFQQSQVLSAVRESARVGAAADLSVDDPEDVASTDLYERLEELNVTYTSGSVTTSLASEDYGGTTISVLQVEVSLEYESLLGLIPTPELLGGRATLPLEDQD